MHDDVLLIIDGNRVDVTINPSPEVSYIDIGTTGLKGDKGDAVAIDGQVTIPYASAVTIDLAANPLALVFDIALTGNIIINFTNPIKNGQKVLLRLLQDAVGSRIVTFGASIKVGSTLTSYVASTQPLVTDVLGFIYNSSSNKFDFVGVNKGY